MRTKPESYKEIYVGARSAVAKRTCILWFFKNAEKGQPRNLKSFPPQVQVSTTIVEIVFSLHPSCPLSISVRVCGPAVPARNLHAHSATHFVLAIHAVLSFPTLPTTMFTPDLRCTSTKWVASLPSTNVLGAIPSPWVARTGSRIAGGSGMSSRLPSRVLHPT